MEATRLLISHHQKMKRLFKQLGKARGNAAPLLKEIADDLVAHMLIEEHIFYPAVRALKEPSILEGFEEHVIGRFTLERLLATKPSAESFKAKGKALKDIMEDHNDEEEEELFPTVRKAMSATRLRELGDEMKTLFDEGVAKVTSASCVSSTARRRPRRRSPRGADRRRDMRRCPKDHDQRQAPLARSGASSRTAMSSFASSPSNRRPQWRCPRSLRDTPAVPHRVIRGAIAMHRSVPRRSPAMQRPLAAMGPTVHHE